MDVVVPFGVRMIFACEDSLHSCLCFLLGSLSFMETVIIRLFFRVDTPIENFE